ncbi:MAG: hypothetical protein LC794_18550 [Acidobacteria bacterium]|nr:hypothetical protein [Acidobacteriota bacterium]
MATELESYFLNPPAGSAAARAAEFGTDLTLTLENLRLTPEERIRKLDSFIEGVAKLKASVRVIGPTEPNAKQHH